MREHAMIDEKVQKQAASVLIGNVKNNGAALLALT